MTIDAAGQRIIVLGCSGSGKSTLAVALAARLGLPFVPTDDIYWRGAWEPTPADEVRAWLRGTTMRENWVLDGNFDAQRDLAWSRANLIVWLDFPLPTVMLRVLRRNLTWWLTGATVWGGQRMTLRKAVNGARHALTSHGLKRRDYPGWLASLDAARVVRLRSPGAVARWLRPRGWPRPAGGLTVNRIVIDDPADRRIAPYVQVRERDLVGRRGEFIAEGEVVLRVLLGGGARCRADSVLVAEKRLSHLIPLLKAVDAATPIYVASQAVMDAVVGFHIHRGMLAHGMRPDAHGADALLAGLPPRAIVLALFGIANHDNMGGIFRNAAAFGVDAVLLDATCCDPLYRKAIRVSVGATLKVPFARLAREEDVLGLLSRHRFEPLALAPAGAELLGGLERPDRAAILLGAEGPGLPPPLIAGARSLAIPMAPGWDSLNVAAASAVVLHHLATH